MIGDVGKCLILIVHGLAQRMITNQIRIELLARQTSCRRCEEPVEAGRVKRFSATPPDQDTMRFRYQSF